MNKVQRSRWIPALCAALLWLLPGPVLGQPKSREDPVSDADVVSAKVRDLLSREQYAQAVPLAEEEVRSWEAIAAKQKGSPPKSHQFNARAPEEDLAEALDHLARALIETGDYVRPGPLLLRAAQMHDRVLPEDSPRRNMSPMQLGRLAAIKGDFAEAERWLKKIVDHGNPYDAGDIETGSAFAFNELGRLYTVKGDFLKAEPLLQSAQSANNHREIVLRGLAELHLARGELTEVEPLLQKAVKEANDWVEFKGGIGVDFGWTLDDLGSLALALGVPARAERAFSRALDLQEKALGPEHRAVATSLVGLGRAYLAGGEPARADAPLTRALAILEKKLGPDHLETATAALALGDLRATSGDHRAADALYLRAIAAREKALGPGHAAVAEGVIQRARLYFAEGDLKAAADLAEKARAVFEKALSPNYVRVADALDLSGMIAMVNGDLPLARRQIAGAAEIRDAAAQRRLAVGTEDQKVATMAALGQETDLLLSLAAMPGADKGAAESALLAVIRRKGRVLDALSEGRAALRDRRSQEDRTLLDELVSIQARIVDLIVRGPGIDPVEKHRAAIADLEKQKQKLEAEVSKQSAKLVLDDRMVMLADVRQAIPADAALVEMFVYHPWSPAKEAKPPRIAAFVARRKGDVASVDLGEASAIEAQIGPLREALADPKRDPRVLSRDLDEKVMRKVRPLLGDARRILLSPDGALNLVPFGALIDEGGHVLLERWSISYLSSGRDLVRYTYDETPPVPGPAAVVIGAPDFGDPDRKRSRYRPEDKVLLRRSIDMGDIRFPLLPGTESEAKAIGATIPGAKVLIGADATEEAVKAVDHPRILHLATHGFFLPSQEVLQVATGTRGTRLGTTIENPLLRAGMAFASANQPVPGREDGILTALEASGLDLYGTRLVVLSACETGVGEARNGDGVYGLRRALVVAGAQTLVMSLWKISDEGTRDMMIAYYKRLQQGGGRSEAMREVALEMRASPGHAHPYYWASFIVSGDGSSLDGKDVPPDPIRLARVPPSARGCGCAVAGEDRGGAAAAVGLAISIGLRARRRAGASRWSRRDRSSRSPTRCRRS